MKAGGPEPERTTQSGGNRCLLATMTGELFQPARLYYAIPGRTIVTERLRCLECMVKSPLESRWQWLYHAEAKAISIGNGYDAVPNEKRPIILGSIRFTSNKEMTIQVNSFERAVAAARFFGSRLGAKTTAMRCRVVNRCFDSAEGPPKVLMETLDKDVTVCDSKEAMAAAKKDFKRTASEVMRKRIRSREDIPMVEDFPLAPEEESPGFEHLNVALTLRFVRAVEHWKGNQGTLTEIIARLFESPRNGS